MGYLLGNKFFGERIALVQSSDKVTEEFTGKELDEETQLNEFGARKYDAQLGVWISVDPARQFASPYVYAGNGANPINGVDPDGGVWMTVREYYTNDVGNGLFNFIALFGAGQKVMGVSTWGVSLENTADLRVKNVVQRWFHNANDPEGVNNLYPLGAIRIISQVKVDRAFADYNFREMYKYDDLLGDPSQTKLWDPFVFPSTYYEFDVPVFLLESADESNLNVDYGELTCISGCTPE